MRQLKKHRIIYLGKTNRLACASNNCVPRKNPCQRTALQTIAPKDTMLKDKRKRRQTGGKSNGARAEVRHLVTEAVLSQCGRETNCVGGEARCSKAGLASEVGFIHEKKQQGTLGRP
ncbi:hypothetical protein J4Q44_G00213090 [Coregonus suidteri]|uniref:Uncharacterized protein n=1 Tax=Coregonus suidteri TaxID=861788 RepID=A0AAN8L9P2_9TELE